METSDTEGELLGSSKGNVASFASMKFVTAPPKYEDVPLSDMDDSDDSSDSDDSDNSDEESDTDTDDDKPKIVQLDTDMEQRDVEGPDMAYRRFYNNTFAIGAHRNTLFRFAKNSLHTTKYTWWNFIPKNLYEQFHRLANFYFLVIACLTLVPDLTNISPVSSISPLVFVLGVSAFKEAYDDWKRATSDKSINYSKCTALRDGKWQTILWKQVQVGDIIKVPNNTTFPADLILIGSSLESGICYIQTANLDGETNLKVRQALEQTTKIKTQKQLSEWDFTIECEQPNKDLYNFDGRLFVDQNKKTTALSLSNAQILLRGCVLKNTDWVHGIVVFTGNDTKLRQNARDPPSKRSTLEKQMNTGLLSLFLFMFALCIFCAILGSFFTTSKEWYLETSAPSTSKDRLWNLIWLSMSYAIVYSYMIPISLYVSMEVVKLAQTFLLDNDINMYYEPTDTPAKSKTSNLNEELGQIDFIFSDKTGTLTCNEMELVKCSIGGEPWSFVPSAVPPENAANNNNNNNVLESASEKLVKGQNDILTPEDLQQLLNTDKNASLFYEFFLLLSVCHTVLPEKDHKNPGKLIYQASSPDEYALVQKAADLGFRFLDRTFDTVTVEIFGQEHKFEILNIIEFTSNRKRMSVICRLPDGRIRLYCKGADSIICARLSKTQQYLDTLTEHLHGFATDGLRTLCCAYSDLDPKKYATWNQKFNEANASIKDRKNQVEKVAELIEQELILVGATAIEDKLQDGVPDTIADLRKANMNIWVLTGDKQETAINIGLSCRLLTGTNVLTLFNDVSEGEPIVVNAQTTKRELQKALAQVKQGNEGEEFAFVIDGNTLTYALDNGENAIEPIFMELAFKCKTLICCRVSPSQKRAVVERVKRYKPLARTLAIGDGANDVSMIQEAHIGIGIFGKEGTQAAMSSDYAVAQFKYLRHLLLVHGRWSYKRTAKLVLYSFYKNATLSLCLFWYMLFSLYSAQNFFDSFSLSGFNVVFACFPILFYATLNQDVKARMVFLYPELYQSGQRSEDYSLTQLWGWVALGVFHSIIIFFGSIYWFDDGIVNSDGKSFGMWALGTIAYTVVIMVVNIKIAIETDYFTWMNWVAILGSIGVWFLYANAYSAICSFSGNECGVMNHVWVTPSFWLLIVILTIICVIPDVTYNYWQRNYYPKAFQVIQEVQYKARKQKKRLRRKEAFNKVTAVFRFSSATGAVPARREAHTGYAFAQDEDTAHSMSMSLTSAIKKEQKVKEKKEKKKKEKREKKEKKPKKPRKSSKSNKYSTVDMDEAV